MTYSAEHSVTRFWTYANLPETEEAKRAKKEVIILTKSLNLFLQEYKHRMQIMEQNLVWISELETGKKNKSIMTKLNEILRQENSLVTRYRLEENAERNRISQLKNVISLAFNAISDEDLSKQLCHKKVNPEFIIEATDKLLKGFDLIEKEAKLAVVRMRYEKEFIDSEYDETKLKRFVELWNEELEMHKKAVKRLRQFSKEYQGSGKKLIKGARNIIFTIFALIGSGVLSYQTFGNKTKFTTALMIFLAILSIFLTYPWKTIFFDEAPKGEINTSEDILQDIANHDTGKKAFTRGFKRLMRIKLK